MKKFSVKIFLLLIPVAIFFAVPGFILYQSNEILSINRVIRNQSEFAKPSIWGLAYSYPVKYYKLELTKIHQPEILILGSSRAMQFRSKFFKPERSFYNAAGAVNKIRFFRLFLKSLPADYSPKLLFVGLDHWWFNEKWDDLRSEQFDADLKEAPNDLRILKDEYQSVYYDWLEGKIKVKELFEDFSDYQRFGISALMQNMGFRNDGSYYYGNFDYDASLESNFKQEIELYKSRKGWFSICDSINGNAVEELKKFLQLCEDKGIKVVGFLPPYAHQLYEPMSKEKELYPNVFELERSLKPLFDLHHFELFDFSDIVWIDDVSGDLEAKDGAHGSEKTYLRMMIQMVERDSSLLEFCDLEFLKSSLEKSADRMEVFGFSF